MVIHQGKVGTHIACFARAGQEAHSDSGTNGQLRRVDLISELDNLPYALVSSY
jgi:hypothetical protein